MSHTYLKQAFDRICTSRRELDYWYVSLVELVPYYGGPEEGGWWGTDTHLIAFQEYPTKEQAEKAATRIRKLADRYTRQAQREYGRHCLVESEWLEQRGLDDSFLPEPDGPSECRVYVTEDLPQDSRGSRHYE